MLFKEVLKLAVKGKDQGVPLHAMKAYWDVEVQLHWLLNSTTTWKWAVGFRTCSWHIREKKISLAPTSNQTMSPQSIRPQRSHCNAYTIMALVTVKKLEISEKFI